MAGRDYKNRAARGKGRKPVAIWVWLLLGFLVGAGSVAFLCLKFSPAPDCGAWIGEGPAGRGKPAGVPASANGKSTHKVPPPDFDFYNLLPDQEVVVPEQELTRPAPVKRTPVRETVTPPAHKPAPPASGRKYLVQVSSVRSPREADALKARLALLGLQARVSRANIKGTTWYRVRLGPFSSAAEVQRVRKRLAGSGYDALVVALK
jgi:cell division septation protein DedD